MDFQHPNEQQTDSRQSDCQTSRQNGYQTPPPGYTPPRPNPFATVSLVLGIASLVMMCTGILPIPLGALGIVFACLSKRGPKLEGTALGGFITSIAGLVSGLLLTVMVYAMIIIGTINSVMENPDALHSSPEELTHQMMESLYGENYKELFEQYGIDYDEMMENIYDN